MFELSGERNSLMRSRGRCSSLWSPCARVMWPLTQKELAHHSCQVETVWNKSPSARTKKHKMKNKVVETTFPGDLQQLEVLLFWFYLTDSKSELYCNRAVGLRDRGVPLKASVDGWTLTLALMGKCGALRFKTSRQIKLIVFFGDMSDKMCARCLKRSLTFPRKWEPNLLDYHLRCC